MLTLLVNYSQFDTRWCTHLLGFNSDPQYTIYNYGCLLCCFASVIKFYNIDTDPLRLNQLFMDNGAYATNSGEYVWGKLQSIFPTLSDLLVRTPNKLTDEQVGQIKTSLDQGNPVILWIDYNPKTVKNDMHFVTAIGYNPNDENDFTIADPLGGKVHSLKDYLGWFKPSARDTIEGYVLITGPKQDTNTVAVNADVFPNLVHGDEQWEKAVAKYMPEGTDPNHTMYEDFARVIAGIQSRSTDAYNQVDKQKGDLAEAQQSAKNLQEQLANEELQRQADQKLYLAQIQALKASSQNVEQVSVAYEGRLTQLQSQIKALMNEKHVVTIQNARLMAKQAESFIVTYFPTFLSWLQKIKR